jgi:hypothetical protein
MLEEIETRAEKATNGPWKASHKVGNLSYISDKNGSVASVSRWCWQEAFPDENVPTADFIAHARTDVPCLVKALRLAIEQRNINAKIGGMPTEEDDAELTQILDPSK